MFIKKIAETFNAAYCYLLLSIETLWTKDKEEERRNLIYGTMYSLMMGVLAPLANLMVQNNAGPCFSYFDFSKKASEPLVQLKQLIKESLAIYGSIGTSDTPGFGDIISTLLPIQNVINNLVSVNLPCIEPFAIHSARQLIVISKL